MKVGYQTQSDSIIESDSFFFLAYAASRAFTSNSKTGTVTRTVVPSDSESVFRDH